jgi:hypothetical protein
MQIIGEDQINYTETNDYLPFCRKVKSTTMENTHNTKKVVVVTGDVTMDWNLANSHQRGSSQGAAWNAEDCTFAYWQRGGAALLADLIKAIDDKASQIVPLTQAPEQENQIYPGNRQYHHSYALWSLHPKSLNKEEKKQVWRVKEFLGLYRNIDKRQANWKKDENDRANLVVIDDANLGFREEKNKEFWPLAIKAKNSDPWVLLKMALPVAKGELWDNLLEQHANRLIVVMTANDLRFSEVLVSRELSWENTAQDLIWELMYNPQVKTLSQCAHVIVSFNAAGALLLSRQISEKDALNKATSYQYWLFYDPKVIEGMWEQDHPGGMIGYTTCLTASIAQQLMIDSEEPDIKQGILNGLEALRKLHLEGYNPQDEDQQNVEASQAHLAFPIKTIVKSLKETQKKSSFNEVKVPDTARFLSRLIVEERAQQTHSWSILEELYIDPKEAVDTIMQKGVKAALSTVPQGQFGQLFTVDRQEIEGYRSIRILIKEYVSNKNWKRPLSISVFGTPGSGKSFGIKQIADTLLPGQIKVLTYNLSQFNHPEELFDAFHQVRDVGLSGLIPLVFWDEFDSKLNGQELGWLRYFLAPMQDGEFQQGQITHSIGPAIFVFAGGTKETMTEFSKTAESAFKGRDFVSRLKGYVNIIGPNPRDKNAASDPYYVIRRAILLRSILESNAPQLFSQEGPFDNAKLYAAKLNIDSGVLNGLLKTQEYKHGTRSMEAIISMSLLAGKDRFERSCLPAEAQLDLHVNATDFQSLVQQIDFVEILAKENHEVFIARLKKEGYRWGSQTDAAAKTHSSLKPYSELPEEEKEQNRGYVRDILDKLESIGYAVLPARREEIPSAALSDANVVERLAQKEHERWLKAKIKDGWSWDSKTDKDAKKHQDLLPWHKMLDEERAKFIASSLLSRSDFAKWQSMLDEERAKHFPEMSKILGPGELPEEEKEKNRDMVRAIPQILAKAGYTIIKVQYDQSNGNT